MEKTPQMLFKGKRLIIPATAPADVVLPGREMERRGRADIAEGQRLLAAAYYYQQQARGASGQAALALRERMRELGGRGLFLIKCGRMMVDAQLAGHRVVRETNRVVWTPPRKGYTR